MLLRIGRKRRAAWEDGTVEDILAFEFTRGLGPDRELRFSVYEFADPGRVVQACAEYGANARTDPQPRCNADLEGLTPAPIPAEDAASFEFIRAAHRNVTLESVETLTNMIQQVVAGRPARVHRVDLDGIRNYVWERLGDQDAEWVGFFGNSPPKWQKLVE